MIANTTSAKLLWTSLLVVLCFGYAFAVVQILLSAGVTPETILNHYQGNEEEMLFAMSVKELVKISHIHMLGMPLIVFPAAWLFSRSPIRDSLKTAVIAATFAGIVLDIGSWWGVRFLGMAMLPSLYLGGALLGGGFVLMTICSLIHIWKEKES